MPRLKQIVYCLTYVVLVLGLFILTPSYVHAADATHFGFATISTGSSKQAGVPFDITISALDANGDIDRNYSSTANLIDETGTIYPTQTGSFTQGQWRGTVYITQTSTADHITASYSTLVGASDAFVVGPDTRMAFLSIVSGNAQTGTVGSQLPTVLSARVTDAFSNPISGLGVNFAVVSVPNNSTNYSVTNNSEVSDANGLVSTSFTLGRKAGIYLITATLTTGFKHTIQFTETAVASNMVSISVTPYVSVIPAGSYMPFKATGYDLYYNEIALPSVTWSVQNGGGTIDTTGVFYAGTTLGNYSNTVKAVSGTVGSTASVSIVDVYKGNVNSYNSSGTTATGSGTGTGTGYTGVLYNVQVEPEVLSLLRNTKIPIMAQGVDYFGNPVSGVSYDFSTTGDIGTVTKTGPNSAVITGSGTGVGTVNIKATQGEASAIAKVVGSGGGSGLNKRLVIENIESPQRVGEPFTLSIAAKDVLNNFITDYTGPLVIADSTGTIDPAVVQPSPEGIWYVQAIIAAASPEVSITVAGDGMVGVSNVFEVVGDPKKADLGLGGGGGGFGNVLGSSISAKINELMVGSNANKYAVVKFIGAGVAAGFGILGASVGGGIMASKGLEAIGRNPFAKGRLQMNLYVSLVVFILAAALAVFACTIIVK
jgi:F0F1-type ATP synthase membrane subunit c/vacuolar-type H+-ATPase subunit K